MIDNPIGEIIEAGTMAFVAQCLEVPRQITPKLYDPPPLGAFVKIGRPQVPVPAPLIEGMDQEQDPFALPFGGGDPASAERRCRRRRMLLYMGQTPHRWSRAEGRRHWALPTRTSCAPSSRRSLNCSAPSSPAC